MTIHETIQQAREHGGKSGALCILEVVTTDGATGYVAAKAGKDRVEAVVRQTGKALPGVAQIVREHTILSDGQRLHAQNKRRLADLMDEWVAKRERMDFGGARSLEAEIEALRAALGYEPFDAGR